MSICQIEERMAGRAYPRTYPTCGLRGACAKRLDGKSLIEDNAALRAETERLREALQTIAGLCGDFLAESDAEPFRWVRAVRIIRRVAETEAGE